MNGLTALILFLFLVTAAYAAWSFAPWVPTRRKDLDRLFTLAGLLPGERFYDLGSGDGRTVFEAARRGADATGVEIAFPFWLWSRTLAPFRPGRHRILWRDLFRVPLHDAHVVFLYGVPDEKLWARLRPKLENELRSGTRIISMTFPIDGWEPTEVSQPEGRLPIYLYRR